MRAHGRHAVAASSWLEGGLGISRAAVLFAFLLSSSGASAATIFGKVFEDVNYGGGAGRSWATASAGGGSARPGARVELFDSTGTYVTSTTTDGSGNYSFAGLAASSYTVRVVSSSASSSRTGYVAGLLPVLTFRTDASSGTAVGVTNHVGGMDPATADAGNAGAGWILNSATGAFTGSGSGKAHAFAPVTSSGPDVTNVDFGWNFDTIVNPNNGGQGSLRQFLTNANTLGADVSLAQSGRPAGIESALFMISNGTAVPGLRATNNYFVGGVTIISPASSLPTVSTPMILNAQLQPGWTSAGPVVRIDGATAGGVGLLLSGTSDGSTIRGFMVTRFTSDGIRVQSLGDNITIAGNWIGTTGTGSAGIGNGDDGIELGGSLAVIGGTNVEDRNVITNSGDEGIDIVGTGATNHVIRGNFIGVDPDGDSGNGNGDVGIAIISGTGNTIGGTSAAARNVISRNIEGIEINTNSNTVQGNYIGTDVTGAFNRGNQPDDGVEIQGSATGNRIGGSSSNAGNVIAFNALDGVNVRSGSGNPVLGNSIHTNGRIGIDLNPDGVTANNGTKNASGPNYDMDHPVFVGAELTGTSLSVSGYVGSAPSQSTFANARVEVFESDDDGSGFGEGKTYLGFLTTDANGNFSGTLDVTGKGLLAGETITGTATDGSNNTSEFGANTGVTVPTAVSLLTFVARARDAAVDLEWQTASEIDNLGFHLYRSAEPTGPWARITTSLIPGLGSSPEGARYAYRDLCLENGITYFYLLEDMETTGATKRHGPASATPQPGEGNETETEEGVDPGDPSTSRITYGDPEATSLRVLRRGRGHVVLELVTGGFYARPDAEGGVWLSIPGFVEVDEPGAPALPVRRTWLEAVVGRKVKLVSVTERDVVSFDGLRPEVTGAPELWEEPDGTLRARRRRTRPGRSFWGPGLHPEAAARLLSVGFQGDEKKALVELAPVRWDRSSERLLLARRLVVRLAFRGREPAETTIDGRRGRRYRQRPSHDERGVVARLATVKTGLYAVRYEDVFGRRGRGMQASSIRLSRQGEAVAFHLEPNPWRFRPGSKLYFLSEGAAANPYGAEAVFELGLGVGGVPMPVVSAAPSGESIPYYWERTEQEQNLLYLAALVDAPDRWLWDSMFAPVRKSYPFQVGHLDTSGERSRLSVWLQGGSDFDTALDHHVRVYVNGSFVDEVSWDAKKAQKLDAEILPGILHNGENQLEIENVGDTDALYSMVMLNRIAVEYPRQMFGEGGYLEGTWSMSGTAEARDLGPNVHVLDVTEEIPQWLSEIELTSEELLRFRAEGGRKYVAASGEAVFRPEVRRVPTSTLKTEANRADYLVIGPEVFLAAAEPLLALRRSQGLETKAVAIEEVYSEFGYGETRPEAVRDFLAYSYHTWQRPSPRYVLLLGDSTYDPKDYLGTGTVNHVPPLVVKTSFLWTASDPAYASVNGEDFLPDLAIGRLPAASVEEARQMVEKVVAFETAGVERGATVVLVTDNPDEGGDFVADAEDIASGLLEELNPRKIYLNRLGATATRDAVVEALDGGASLVSYIGHGAIHLWADENIFDTSQVELLSPQPQQPVVLTMSCLNGYFHFPYFNSIAEELLKAKDKGAIAVFSPSGMSMNTPAHRFHKALLNEMVNGAHERLGDAVLAAQEAYAETGASLELLSIYHLFGDPALELRQVR